MMIKRNIIRNDQKGKGDKCHTLCKKTNYKNYMYFLLKII